MQTDVVTYESVYFRPFYVRNNFIDSTTSTTQVLGTTPHTGDPISIVYIPAVIRLDSPVRNSTLRMTPAPLHETNIHSLTFQGSGRLR